MARRQLMTVALAVSGCSSEAIERRLTWPELEARESVLLVALPEGQRPAAIAVEGAAASSVEVPFPEGAEAVDLYALGYDVPLRELGLRPGEIELGAARSFPFADITYRNRVTPAVIESWVSSEPSELPGSVAFATPIDDACAIAFPLEGRRLPLPGEDPRGMAAFAVSMTDGATLVGMRSGAAFRVDARDVTKIDALSGDSPYLGAALGADGGAWVARRDALLHGELGGGFTSSPAFPEAVTHNLWLDAGGSSERVDVLALSDEGAVARFDGTAWTTLATVATGHVEGDRATGGILRLPDGDAVIMVPVWFPCNDVLSCAIPSEHTSAGSRILRLRGSETVAYPPVEAVAMSLLLEPDGHILLGTYGGELLRRDAADFVGEWQLVGQTPSYVWSLTTFDGGLLTGTGRGEIQATLDRLGDCKPRTFALGHVRHVAPVAGDAGRRTFVIGHEADILRGEGGDFVTVIAW